MRDPKGDEGFYESDEAETSDARTSLLLAVLSAVDYIEALERRVAELESR